MYVCAQHEGFHWGSCQKLPPSICYMDENAYSITQYNKISDQLKYMSTFGTLSLLHVHDVTIYTTG